MVDDFLKKVLVIYRAPRRPAPPKFLIREEARLDSENLFIETTITNFKGMLPNQLPIRFPAVDVFNVGLGNRQLWSAGVSVWKAMNPTVASSETSADDGLDEAKGDAVKTIVDGRLQDHRYIFPVDPNTVCVDSG